MNIENKVFCLLNTQSLSFLGSPKMFLPSGLSARRLRRFFATGTHYRNYVEIGPVRCEYAYKKSKVPRVVCIFNNVKRRLKTKLMILRQVMVLMILMVMESGNIVRTSTSVIVWKSAIYSEISHLKSSRWNLVTRKSITWSLFKRYQKTPVPKMSIGKKYKFLTAINFLLQHAQ